MDNMLGFNIRICIEWRKIDMNIIKRFLKKKKDESNIEFKKMMEDRAACQFELLTENMTSEEAGKIDPLSFYLGFIGGAKEYACGFKDDDKIRVYRTREK